ncbi:proto-oncogene tyrosine-protein kinase receptor Ret, partial [Asbolus verrucosus]
MYFSMSNIRVTIPIDKGKFPTESHPLVTFYAQSDSAMKYSIVGGDNFFKISSTTGEVFLTKKFLESDITITDLDSISARIFVQDSFGKKNRTSLKLDILPLVPLDCDFIVEDLCFWKSAQYRINENTKPTLIGSLASPYLTEMCASYVIKYNLLSKNEEFRIVSSGINRWIESTKPLDRELKSKHSLQVLCTVENAKHSIRNITKNLLVSVLDVDDNSPETRESSIKIVVPSKFVNEDQLVEHGELIFYDKDTTAVNKYKPSILNDTQNILKAQCTEYDEDYLEKEIQTAVHCKLKFTKTVPIEDWTYSVKLQLNDTTLINGTKTVSIPIHLHFANESGYYPTMNENKLKQPQMYPTNKVKVFRTAAPLARLTQPDSKSISDAKYFTVNTIDPKFKDLFNVTKFGGILFVHDSVKLRQAPEFLRVNISWITNDTSYSDELEVEVVKEPRETCADVGPFQWSLCAEYATHDECVSPDACALSTGGSSSVAKWNGPQRCTWRGEKTPSNVGTSLYATCTPDVNTCPDEICDDLELLNDEICPQDCTEKVLIPFHTNKKTGRGIEKGSGVCTCSSVSCQCTPIEFIHVETTTKTTQVEETTLNQTVLLQPNVSRHTGNLTGKILGIELARCGTTCVLGIVAGAFFLGGAVVLIVICWRLDRVHKAVRNKFSDESQDLSAPLSDYIDRSMPEPLPLNFDMTTSLVDTAILSIINKLPTSTVLDETEIHYDEPNISKVTPKEILSFAWQICKGMAYLKPSEKSETNPLNYLSKSQSYIKCGSADKFPENSNFLREPDNNQNDINTQGYETPVKISKKIQTPTNDCPQYYTDMASGKIN